MSNFLAVATVTAALHRLIQASAGADVPGADVKTDRPETGTNGTPIVNIYLYQVAPNAALRNSDLPTRSPAGDLVQRPVAALDLHYLFTFTGKEEELEPQRLLGSVVRTLHAQPFLTPALINAVKTAATSVPPKHPALATTDLADQVERVKFVPLPMNLEELSKLWSVFFQTPYALSVAYQASVVLIEPEVTPISALPVLDRDIAVSLYRRPVIDEIVSAADAGAPILPTSPIAIIGRDLLGDVTRVRLAGSDRGPVDGSPVRLLFDLSSVPNADLRAGVQTVQVAHRTLLGSPPAEHLGVESTVATFALHPTVSAPNLAAGPAITLSLDLTIGPRQDVQLALLDATTEARTHLFPAVPRTADTKNLSFPISGVPAGAHILQVFVDGADSVLKRNAAGKLTGPKVTTP